jgi:chaperonin GroEL
MQRKVIVGKDAQSQLLKGVETSYNAVSSTLGVFGRNVLFYDNSGEITLTKDGISVASQIRNLSNPVENMGASLIKKGAKSVLDGVGDGTTTYLVLAYNLIKNAFNEIKDDTNVVQVKVGIDKACKEIVKKLKEISIQIDENNFDEMILNIAKISSNGDEEVSKYILEALKTVGKEGVVTAFPSKFGDVRMDVVTGMKIEQGYASETFITNAKNLSCELSNPLIIVTDKVLSSGQSIMPMLSYAKDNGRSIFLIVKEISGEAINILIANNERGIVRSCVIENPINMDKHNSLLQDISIITGATFISADSGKDFATHFDPSWFGTSESIIVTRNSTTIVNADSQNNTEAVVNRIKLIQQQIELAESVYEKNHLQDRLAKLVGGIVTILIGGKNSVEAKERYDRTEDALLACKSALDEGVVVGGGTSLLRMYDLVDFIDKDIYTNSHQLLGANLVKNILIEPFYKILKNAGFSEKDIYKIHLDVIKDSNKNSVYNLFKNEIVDGYEEGIIDSMKVARVSLENACSIASSILTTNVVIYDEKEVSDDTRVFDMIQNLNQ